MKRNILIIFLFYVFVCITSTAFAADNAVLINSVEEGLRDVRSPVYFPPSYFFLFIIPFVLLIGGIIALIYFFKKAKREKAEEVPVDTRLPWEIAYEQFEVLIKSSFLKQGQFKEYYSQLSGIIRYYFENQFKIRAPEMTTEEFLWSLDESRDLTFSQKNTLKRFMDSCDIVKFAKYIPRIEEAEESFQLARKLVEETKASVIASEAKQSYNKIAASPTAPRNDS